MSLFDSHAALMQLKIIWKSAVQSLHSGPKYTQHFTSIINQGSCWLSPQNFRESCGKYSQETHNFLTRLHEICHILSHF